MGFNPIPQSYKPLIRHLEDAADGATTYGIALGLVHNPEAKIRFDLENFIGTPEGPGGVPPAQPGLKTIWNNARANRVTMNAALGEGEESAAALALVY